MAYSPITKGLAARCITVWHRCFSPIYLMDEASNVEQRTRYVAYIPKGYRTMRTIHDTQMGDRLETIVMGLGLVRLLQDARRFEEARATLYSLEESVQGADEKSDKPKRIPRKTHVTKTAFCSSASASDSIAVSEMRTQELCIA